MTPFTPLVNVTGQPAASVPFGVVDGLPVGVQLIGPPAGEAMLFRLAAQIEEAQPWADCSCRGLLQPDGGERLGMLRKAMWTGLYAGSVPRRRSSRGGSRRRSGGSRPAKSRRPRNDEGRPGSRHAADKLATVRPRRAGVAAASRESSATRFADDPEFLRKLKPSLIKPRARRARRRSTPAAPQAPSGPQLERPKAKRARRPEPVARDRRGARGGLRAREDDRLERSCPPPPSENGGVGGARSVAEHASSIAKLELELATLELKKKVGLARRSASASASARRSSRSSCSASRFATIAAALATFLADVARAADRHAAPRCSSRACSACSRSADQEGHAARARAGDPRGEADDGGDQELMARTRRSRFASDIERRARAARVARSSICAARSATRRTSAAS